MAIDSSSTSSSRSRKRSKNKAGDASPSWASICPTWCSIRNCHRTLHLSRARRRRVTRWCCSSRWWTSTSIGSPPRLSSGCWPSRIWHADTHSLRNRSFSDYALTCRPSNLKKSENWAFNSNKPITVIQLHFKKSLPYIYTVRCL